MNCFPCFRSRKSSKKSANKDQGNSSGEMKAPDTKMQKAGHESTMGEVNNVESAAQTFTFRELATATKNFRQECLLGEGGFGRVFKGTIPSSGQVVAVKQLDRHGLAGNKEFMVEVVTLCLLHHENLVNLIGYCADGDQRLLVYEFMQGGSVQDHLLDMSSERKPLDWFTRMKIAFGASKGLEYLHDKANPPIIYHDLKPSNILLDGDLNPKLCGFGLAKLHPSGDKMHVQPRVMGTYGYCAPEYQSGQLTTKSDVYSFGVVLLELISGRRAEDTTKPITEQNLVTWAQPFFKDPKRFPDLADPLLNKRFPEKDLNQAVAIAAMCLQEEPAARPLMSDVVTALSFLSEKKEIIVPTPQPAANPPSEGRVGDHNQLENEAEDSSDSEDEESKDSSDCENEQSEYHQSQDGDKLHHQDENYSDSDDGDSVDSEDNVAEEGHRQTTTHSISWVDSNLKLMGDGILSNRGNSTCSRDRSVAVEKSGSIGSNDGSISSSENSSSGSHDGSGYLSQYSSKVSRHSVSRKSSKVSEKGSASTSHKSSRKLQSRNTSMSRDSSIDSRNGIGSLSHKSKRKDDDSYKGSESSSSLISGFRDSEHGSIHLDHTDGSVSEDGISHLQ